MSSFSQEVQRNQIIVLVRVVTPRVSKEDPIEFLNYDALLDTGATNSGISDRVIADLKLIPMGTTTVQ